MTRHHPNSSAQSSNRWRPLIWSGAVALWLAPLIAMQLTREVAWGPLDFAIFGAMLFGVCGAYELAARLSSITAYRAGFAITLVAGSVLAWMNLAVGVIGSEDDPANLMFAGILFLGAIGGVLARFSTRGMTYTLMAMASAQALVGAVTLVVGLKVPIPQFVILTGVFMALWLISAWLFNRAGEQAALAPSAAPRK